MGEQGVLVGPESWPGLVSMGRFPVSVRGSDIRSLPTCVWDPWSLRVEGLVQVGQSHLRDQGTRVWLLDGGFWSPPCHQRLP